MRLFSGGGVVGGEWEMNNVMRAFYKGHLFETSRHGELDWK